MNSKNCTEDLKGRISKGRYALVDVSIGDEIKTFQVHKSEPSKAKVFYAPFIMCEHTEKTLKEYNDFMFKYRTQHCCCPKCGSKNYSTTLAGYIFNSEHPEEYKNKNAVNCLDCGWRGIIHDLVPEKDA